LNLDYLQTFITVVEKGGFSKAGEVLSLTQPAVSFQIQTLEKELGEKLIDRSSAKIKLTPAGEVVYKYAHKLLKEKSRLEEALAKMSGAVRGELYLGASTIPGEYILPAILAKFKRDFPDVDLHLQIEDSYEVSKKVSQHELDIGFTGSKFPNHPVIAEDFASDELLLITSSNHPFASKKEVSLSEIFKEPFILREEGSGTRKTLQEALRKKGYNFDDLNVVMELGSTQSVITGVVAGLGISVISEWALKPYLKIDELKAFKIKNLPLKRKIYLVYHPRAHFSHTQKVFLDYCRKLKNSKS
jgi:DNA-binding transcriptional LysR family regulator